MKQLITGKKYRMSQSNKKPGELQSTLVGSKPNSEQTFEKGGIAPNAGERVSTPPKIRRDPITNTEPLFYCVGMI
jgi:hypothetical protein